MFVKKFEAPTLAKALEQVKAEFGEEALILSTETKKNFFRKDAGVVVVAAREDQGDESGTPKPERPPEVSTRTALPRTMLRRYQENTVTSKKREWDSAMPPPSAEIPVKRVVLSERDAERERQATPAHHSYGDGLENALAPLRGVESRKGVGSKRKAAMERRLGESGFSGAKALQIASEFEENTHEKFLESADLRVALCRVLPKMKFAPTLSWLREAYRLRFVGAPGSGKTSVLVRCALELKRQECQIVLVGRDPWPVRSGWEFSKLASLLQVPYHPNALPVNGETYCLEEAAPLTPVSSWVPSLLDSDLSRCDILVLDATSCPSLWLKCYEQVAAVELKGVVFTKCEWGPSWGAVHEFLSKSQLTLLGTCQGRSPQSGIQSWDHDRWTENLLQKSRLVPFFEAHEPQRGLGSRA